MPLAICVDDTHLTTHKERAYEKTRRDVGRRVKGRIYIFLVSYLFKDHVRGSSGGARPPVYTNRQPPIAFQEYESEVGKVAVVFCWLGKAREKSHSHHQFIMIRPRERSPSRQGGVGANVRSSPFWGGKADASERKSRLKTQILVESSTIKFKDIFRILCRRCLQSSSIYRICNRSSRCYHWP